MSARAITSADLSEVTGYTRHQLRGLLNELPDYQIKAERARVAREYTKHDLAVITVCCELEKLYGLRRDAVAALSQSLAQALLGPRIAGMDAYLAMTITPPDVQYLQVPVNVRQGLVIPLREIFARLDGYLLADHVRAEQHQRALDFGPLSVIPASEAASTRKERSVIDAAPRQRTNP